MILPAGNSRINPSPPNPPPLNRTTFRTSRQMDFFSAGELVTQTGHEVADWPLVILKELIDNGLDACEEANVPPVVCITADATGLAVRDNGPGLPEATLRGALDFSVRVSSREAYVSPCRGAQGNALKTLLPMPWVLDPDHGTLLVRVHGKQHTLRCGCDPISQRAVITDEVAEPEKVKTAVPCTGEKASLLSGTEVRLAWAPRSYPLGDFPVWPFDPLLPVQEGLVACRAHDLVTGYALFNPHATFRLDWFGRTTTWEATDPNWTKWRPNQPTSPHWYDQRHLERLIAAYLTHDRDNSSDRLVSDFVAEFDGLSSSQKQTRVLDAAGLKRAKLSVLALDNGLDSERIARLLAAMQANARPVKPERLGILGEAHLAQRLLALGVVPESFTYSRRLGKDGLPWVLESAFGWLGKDARDQRKIYTGANWSAAIKNPFRSFGGTGEGLETYLAQMRATRDEPIVFVLHLAHPRVEYTDRGKSAIVIGNGEES